MAADKTIILTHGDLDGMVSAILILRRLPESTIRITNGDKLGQELTKLACDPQGPLSVYLTDLPLVAAVAKNVRAAITTMANAGRSIHIYDHHLGWGLPDGRAIQPLCKTFIVLTKKTTAAAIVWRSFLRAESTSQRWLKLLSEKDDSGAEDIRRDFGILAALMQPQHWSLQDAALREFASGLPPSGPVRQLAEWYYLHHRAREKEIAGRATVFTTGSGRRIAWIDLRGERGHVMVAHEVMKQHGVELAATVIAKGVMLGGGSIDQGVDLASLHGEHENDGVRLIVAGHKSPVRISPKVGQVDEHFLAATQRFLRQQL